jgi:uncharacterized protein
MVVAKAKRRTALIPRKIKKILRELKQGLVEIYGDQLKAVYLFGSFARGEGKLPDSDIDVMIVLDGEFNYWKMYERASKFIADLCLENEVVVSAILASQTKYIQSKMPLYMNVRKEGVPV